MFGADKGEPPGSPCFAFVQESISQLERRLHRRCKCWFEDLKSPWEAPGEAQALGRERAL